MRANLSIAFAAVAGVVVGVWALWCVTLGPVEQPQHFGWAGEQEAMVARNQVADELPELVYAAGEAPDTGNRLVCLWHFTRLVNSGKHLPNINQQTGDCVSWGTSNALEYSLCAHVVQTGKYGSFRENFPPYIYGISRVQIGRGRLGGNAGSTGSWAAKGVQDYGVLRLDTPGLPEYTKALADKWGRNPGPPQQFIDIGRKYKAEARLVTTFKGACEAISCGNAIAVCSMQGFLRMQERNGRIEGVPVGTWPHCMSFVAYDTRPGREALYCLNSWGPNAHAKAERYAELDGAPPGGFWVDSKTAERMLAGKDSYAYSFTGFAPTPIFPMLDGEHE